MAAFSVDFDSPHYVIVSCYANYLLCKTVILYNLQGVTPILLTYVLQQMIQHGNFIDSKVLNTFVWYFKGKQLRIIIPGDLNNHV